MKKFAMIIGSLGIGSALFAVPELRVGRHIFIRTNTEHKVPFNRIMSKINQIMGQYQLMSDDKKKLLEYMHEDLQSVIDYYSLPIRRHMHPSPSFRAVYTAIKAQILQYLNDMQRDMAVEIIEYMIRKLHDEIY